MLTKEYELKSHGATLSVDTVAFFCFDKTSLIFCLEPEPDSITIRILQRSLKWLTSS